MSLSHLTKFPWVLPIFEYDHLEHLLGSLDKSIVAPAEAKVKALEEALKEGRRKIEAELIKPQYRDGMEWLQCGRHPCGLFRC